VRGVIPPCEELIMPSGRLRCALISLVCLGFARLASAQPDSVAGTISVFAGVPNCTDSDQTVPSQLPSAMTSAACTAANGASASGATSADLTTGSVGLEVFANPVVGGYAGGSALAALTDQLHFTVPGLAPGADLLVRVTFTLAGTFSPDALFQTIYGRYLDYNLSFHDFTASGTLTTTPFLGPTTFSEVVSIPSPFLDANVAMTLFVPGIEQGSVEFLHTATIALDLPPGVTFTSESGVFLTAPEPASTTLGVASLLALACLRQRRLRLP
jgi:hypothetical protein